MKHRAQRDWSHLDKWHHAPGCKCGLCTAEPRDLNEQEHERPVETDQNRPATPALREEHHMWTISIKKNTAAGPKWNTDVHAISDDDVGEALTTAFNANPTATGIKAEWTE